MPFFDGTEVEKTKAAIASYFTALDEAINVWTTKALNYSDPRNIDWPAVLREIVQAGDIDNGRVYGVLIFRQSRRRRTTGGVKNLTWNFGIYIFKSVRIGPAGNNSEDELDRLIEALDAKLDDEPYLGFEPTEAGETEDGITGTEDLQVESEDLIPSQLHFIQCSLAVKLQRTLPQID